MIEGDELESFVNSLVDNAVNYMQLYGFWFGFIIIVLESIFPWIPLCVFIALNITSFGPVFGFLLSLGATITGCLISYVFFRFLVGKRIDNYINKNKREKLKKVIESIKQVGFSNLVLLMSLPFTPAFSLNIACGITNYDYKKYLLALLISKPIIVFFWGFVGTSLLESITDFSKIIIICILLLIAFILSKIVVDKFNIE